MRDWVNAKLHTSACLLVGGALVSAPWMYGTMRSWTMRVLAGMLTALLLCWLGSALCGKRLRALPSRAVIPAVFVFVAGWLVVLTGPQLPLDAFGVKHFIKLSARWPGSVLVRTPIETMWVISGLLGAFFLLVDPATSGLWRARFCTVAVATGGLIELLGIVQSISGAPAIFWDVATPTTGSFFATFFEEGIGVSFVSLVWPLAAGGLLGRLGTPTLPTGRKRIGIMICAATVILGWLGLAVIGSLLGLIVGGLIVAILTVWVLWRLPLMELRTLGLRCGAVAGLCAVLSVTGAIVSGKVPAFHSHWSKLQAALVADGAEAAEKARRDFRMRPDGLILSGDNPNDASFSRVQRRKVREACFRMIPKAGLLGFGPGSWTFSYPHFTDDALLRTHYLQMQFAHQDFLQALVEWGVLGTAAWAVVFFGGVSGGVYRLRRYRSKGGSIGEEEGMIAGALAGLVGVLICACWHFPLQVPSIQLYVAVLLGILWSAGERRGWSEGKSAQDVIPKAGAT